MSHDGTPEVRPRSTVGLTVRAVLASVYFASIFFIAIPWALLLATGGGAGSARGARRLALIAIGAASVVVTRLVARFVLEGRGTHVPLDPPQRLLAQGLYGRLRNPMYLMYVVIILGEAILFASWPITAYALVFWLVFHLYVVRREEPALRRRFGECYDAYRRTVPRWLPHRRARPRG